MEHYHKFQNWITYFHTTNWHLIPIKSESLSKLWDKKEFTDIYWNEIILDKNEIDIAFSDKWIYHNFHNENFFKSNKNYFKFLWL